MAVNAGEDLVFRKKGAIFAVLFASGFGRI